MAPNSERFSSYHVFVIVMLALTQFTVILDMPLVGKLSDKVDKFKLFVLSSIWLILVVLIYTHLTPVPLWFIMIINVLMMIGIMSRMVPSMALTSALPEMRDRGAFMSISSSLQQIAGGVAAAIGGMIVVQKDKSSPIEHFGDIGWLITVITLITIFLMYRISNVVKARSVTTIPNS